MWAFVFKCQSNVSLFKNKTFLLVLLNVTDKTKGGKTGKEQGEEKLWRQGLEKGSPWVENIPVVSPRQNLRQRNHAEKLMENQSKIFLAGWPFSKSSISFKRKNYQKNVVLLILGREVGGWGDKPEVKISKFAAYALGAWVPTGSSFRTGWYWSFVPASGITASLAFSQNHFSECSHITPLFPLFPPSLLPSFLAPFFLLIFLTAARKIQHLGRDEASG